MAYHTSAATLRFGTSLSQARAAIVLIHGRGSSAQDIASMAESLTAEGCLFLAPSARNGTWYPERFFMPIDQNEPGLSSGLSVIAGLVDEVLAAGLPAERIAVAGFSQGACLALEFAARQPRRYAFIAGLSGALIGPLDTPRPLFALRGTPVLLGCAERDAHIPLEFVEKSAEVLKGSGADVTKQIYPGTAHTVYRQEIDWINARLATLPVWVPSKQGRS